MLTATEIIDRYIAFFEKRGHKRIPNAPLVLQDDPTTLFTSSGMQPLVPYLLGKPHPMGKRLVNVQNCFRAQDIEEVGDNRHTTFFRMLGNWSLGDYFKEEQLPWFFEFLVDDLHVDKKRLYVSVFNGYKSIPRDDESAKIWRAIFEKAGINPEGRIFFCGAEDNWWSRAGEPENMPPGEPGGPDSEVYYDLKPQDADLHGSFKQLSNKEKLLEIGNSVFMQYQKRKSGTFLELPQQNVDFGGGLERLLLVVEKKSDVFQTSLFAPIISAIEQATQQKYDDHMTGMRVIADHLTAAVFIVASSVTPSNKEQGYVLRRLLRRSFDKWDQLGGKNITSVIEAVVEQYKKTDPYLVTEFEGIKHTILEEQQRYTNVQREARRFVQKKYIIGDELKGTIEITPDDAFLLYTTHGLSPTQIKSLGYSFDEQLFSEKMKSHQALSRKGAEKKFKGGLADTEEKTVMGHTATHLLHQALRDVLGSHVHQTGSNITTERIRFDFNYDQKLTDEQLQHIENIVREKIQRNLPVHFEILQTEEAKKIGAIGLFEETYDNASKIYFIGGSSKEPEKAYSIEFCGGPHVDFTGKLKTFTIVKQENLGKGQRRIYAILK